MNAFIQQTTKSPAPAKLATGLASLAVLALLAACPPTIHGVVLEIGRVGSSVQDIALADQHAYTVGDGFVVYDISDPLNPFQAARIGSGLSGSGSVVISGQQAFVATANDGTFVYDISDPTAPVELARLPDFGRATSLAVQDNLLFLATSQQRVQILIVDNPANPLQLGQINTGNVVSDMLISGSHAYLAAGQQGLLVYDVSNPTSPAQRGNVNFGGAANAVTAAGSLAYVAFGNDGLRILDLSDPASPQPVGHLPARGFALDVAVDGSFAYVLDQTGGLQVVDISNPSSPREVDSFVSSQPALTVAAAEDIIFLGSDPGGLRFLLLEESPAPATPDKFTTGSLSVTIEPPAANDDGARWSVHARPNRPSAFREENLAAGRHEIRFKDLVAWKEPADFKAVVAGGGEAGATATFLPVPRFYFKAVPEQEARHGETLEFILHTDDPEDPQNPGAGASLLLSASPQPAGAVTLDPATGLVRFTPDELDRLPFTLRLTAGGQEATAVITPHPNLPPEETVIAYDRALPDEESRDYIHITETMNPPEPFNDSGDPIPTLSVDISGKALVFEQGHAAELLPAYDNRSNIKRLNLYADRIIIRSPLRLPQTHVTIHARELRFEGNGRIDTTPRPRNRKPKGAVYGDGLTRGRTGDPGLPGGDIDVFVERFDAEEGEPRFILRGGRGGPAGEGRNGQAHEDLLRDDDGNRLFPIDSTAWRNLLQRRGVSLCGVSLVFGNLTAITYSTHFSVDNNPPLTVLCGKSDPPRGENAIPSGKPGAGGPGGTLHGTVNLLSYADLEGGPAGAQGNNYVGGTLFGPFAHSQKMILDGKLRTGFQTVLGVAGKSATALSADKPAGDRGRATLEPNGQAWLHSFALRSVLAFAKDAYLNGRVAEARALLAEYRDIIRALQTDAPDAEPLDDEAFAEAINLNQILLEMDILVHRIDSNLDYFGNPAGWVPMLSFEANLQAFRDEVDQSIPILYHTFWLSHAADELRNTTTAASATRDKLVEELDSLEGRFNEAQLAIPRLSSIAEDLKIKIASTQSKLAALERQLTLRAQQNLEEKNKLPLWKKALGTLAVASHLVPVGQPVVGRIGTGLGLIGQVDLDDPIASASTLAPKAIDAFAQKNITVCFKSDSVTNETKKARLKRLTECGKTLGGELKQLAELFKSSQIDKTELEAELARIKALDPAFQQITEELAELNKQKEDFGLQLETALQAVATLTDAMNQNLAATHEIERRLAHNLAALDHNALLHIEAMGRRAKDRLLKQQYFVAKAFQYRTLKPYDGNFQLNTLLDSFRELVDVSTTHIPGSERLNAFKSLYEDEIRQIIQSTLNNFDAPDRAQSIQFELNAEELRELNGTGRAVIQLKDRLQFGDTDDNIRISDIRTTQMDVQPVGGPIGTLATIGVKFTHLGISRLTSKGRTFLFRHYQTEEVNPIFWQTSYDGLDDTFNNSELSPAEQSLLESLLGPAASTENLLLFSRPAAFAEIEITKDVITDNRIDLAIDQLRVRVSYEFETEGVARPELDVRTIGGHQPVIVVSQPDINGRRDGIGDFSRVYQPFTTVTLVAPATYGDLPFDRWIVNGTEQPAGVTFVSISLEQADELAEARYATPEVTGTPPEFVLQPQGLVAAVGATATFTAAVSGSEPISLQWFKDGLPLQDGGRISGATTVNLVIADLQTGDSGGYTLEAGNAAGAVTSQPAILSVTTASLTILDAGPDQVGFQFETVPGLRYTVERKIRLSDPEWTPVETHAGTGTLMQFTRPTITTNAAAFFRLRVDMDAN